jgi:hypothetical protein
VCFRGRYETQFRRWWKDAHALTDALRIGYCELRRGALSGVMSHQSICKTFISGDTLLTLCGSLALGEYVFFKLPNLIQLLKGFLQTTTERRVFYELTQLHIG